VIESLKARLPEVPAEAGLIFATADFGTDALAAARESGVALLRVVDGRTATTRAGGATRALPRLVAGVPHATRRSRPPLASRVPGCSKRGERT